MLFLPRNQLRFLFGCGLAYRLYVVGNNHTLHSVKEVRVHTVVNRRLYLKVHLAETQVFYSYHSCPAASFLTPASGNPVPLTCGDTSTHVHSPTHSIITH